jgi:glycosyltransferase involved in cell wall biosynthesis
MQTVSSLTICQDEEEYILHMLKFLNEIVKPDEYVIVDGGSLDSTVEVIEKFKEERGINLKLVKNPMPDSFSIQRNIALDNCSGDWILHIDADETYSESIKTLISSAKSEGYSKIFGFVFPTAHLIKDPFHMLEGCGADYHLRFFRNDSRIRYFGDVHEQISFEGMPIINGVDGFTLIYANSIAMKHYSLIKNEEDLKIKGKRYLQWLKRSQEAGIPLTDENHFIRTRDSAITEGKFKELPKEWY